MQTEREKARTEAAQRGLYSSGSEHDACGVGFVADLKGRQSHRTIEDALLILRNLDHRGAVGADPLCGDGAGILIQIPDAFYREKMAAQGVVLPAPGDYGVGVIFLPQEAASRAACEEELERSVRREGQVVLGWRDVPVDRHLEMSPTVKASELPPTRSRPGRWRTRTDTLPITAKSTLSKAITTGSAPGKTPGARRS